jgi:hypothetical protein
MKKMFKQLVEFLSQLYFPKKEESESLSQVARSQFLQLQRKGLGISVFTL